MRARIDALLPALVLAGTLAAQSTSTQFSETKLVARKNLITRSVFGRIELGQLTPDGHVDGVMDVQGTPMLLYGVDAHDGAFDLTGPASDWCVVKGAGEDGFDALAFGNATGVHLLTIDRDTNVSRVSTLAGIELAAPPILRSGDMDGDGKDDLVVLGSDRNTLRIFHDPKASPVPVTVPVAPAAIVHELQLLDWTGTRSTELVAITGRGLEVRDRLWQSLYFAALGAPGDLLIPFRQQGYEYERLALISRPSGSDQWLFVGDQDGIELPLWIGPIDAVGADAGDCSSTGFDDLLLSQQASHDVFWLKNTGVRGASFKISEPTAVLVNLGVTGPAPANQSGVATGDIDQDGDVDMITGVESIKEVFVGFNYGRGTKQAPLVDPVVYTWYTDTAEAEFGYLEYRVRPPADLDIRLDHVEIRTWRRELGTFAIGNEVLRWDIVPLRATGPSSVYVQIPDTLGYGGDYNVCLRFVGLDHEGRVRVAGPPHLEAFATNVGTLDVLQFELGVPWIPIPLVIVGPLPVTGGDVGTGDIPIPCLPCFVEEELPTPIGMPSKEPPGPH